MSVKPSLALRESKLGLCDLSIIYCLTYFVLFFSYLYILDFNILSYCCQQKVFHYSKNSCFLVQQKPFPVQNFVFNFLKSKFSISQCNFLMIMHLLKKSSPMSILVHVLSIVSSERNSGVTICITIESFWSCFLLLNERQRSSLILLQMGIQVSRKFP